MSTGTRLGLLGTGIAVLAVVLWLARRPLDSDPDVHHVEPERTSAPAVAPAEVTLASPATVDGSMGAARDPESTPADAESATRKGEVPGSVGEFAAGYYGDQWLDVRPELAQRINLSMAAHLPIPPVEGVLGELAQQMRISDGEFARWKLRYMPPEPVDLTYLRQKYSDALDLDAAALANLETRLFDDRALILADLEQLRAVCDAHLRRKCEARQFDFAPFAVLETRHLPEKRFHAFSTGIQSWSFSWGLAEDEDPEFPRLRRSLEAAAKRVAATIRTFLAELKK